MDKDEFLKILESTSCHNIDNYVYDREWSILSGLPFTQDENKHNRSFKNINQKENQIVNESNSNQKEKNILKILDNELEESQFYEKIKKEAEDSRIYSSHKFAQEFHNNMERTYQNQSLFFNKYLKSKARDRYNYPALSILNNLKLEKNYLKKNVQEYFPGLKPSSSWPMALDDLIEKLSNLNLDEMFHQPFDMGKTMHNETKEFIRYYYSLLLNLKEADENQILLYKEYLEKAIQVFITVKIHEGSYTNFLDMLIFLKQIYEESQIDQNSKILFSELFTNATTKCGGIFQKLSEYICSLSRTLPLMRNYSISDIFYISKNILFSPSQKGFNSNQSYVSIATDSTYIYIIMSGVAGSMLKVGTGINSTEKGKVYFSKQFESEDSVNWVLCKQKLYLKKSSNEIGCLEIINPNSFETEGKIKLMINESCMHSLIKKKNENYILLSDNEKLKIILLEQKLNPNAEESLLENFQEDLAKSEALKEQKLIAEEDEDYSSDEECSPTEQKLRLEKKVKEISKLLSHISVVLYEFDVDSNSDKTLSDDKENMITELEESFSQLYSKSECKKALLMANWDFEKAALFLIDKADKIKEQLLLPCGQIVLFQSKIDPMIIESRNQEYQRPSGNSSVFDIVLFEDFQWIHTENYLIAYKLKAGYAYLFSLEEKDVRFIKPQEYLAFEEKFEQEEEEKEIKDTIDQTNISKTKETAENQNETFIDQKNKEESKPFEIDSNKVEFEKKENGQLADDGKQSKKDEQSAEDYEDKRLERKLAKKYIRGSLLKKVNAIELSKHDYSITYDQQTHNYFLITNSFSTQSIIKINTMEEHYNSLTDNYMKNTNYNSIEQLLDGLNNPEIIKNFEKFYETILDILFIINTRKPDLHSKYRNWNVYLFSQFDKLYNSIDLDVEGDYPRKLGYYFKIMQSRFEKTLEYDYNEIKKIMDDKILKNYETVKDIKNPNKELRKYKIKKKIDENNSKSLKIQLDIGKWFFFANYNSVNFELKKESENKTDNQNKNKKEAEALDKDISKETLNLIDRDLEYYLENKIDYYLCSEGAIDSLDQILNIVEKGFKKYKNKEDEFKKNENKLIKNLYLLYAWFESADVSIGLQYANSKTNQTETNPTLLHIKQTLDKALDLIENLYQTENSNLKNLVFMIVLCGWECIAFDAESQVNWFFRAYEYSESLLVSIEKLFENNKFKKYEKNNQLENLTIESKISKIALLNNIDKEHSKLEYVQFLPIKILIERINALNDYQYPYLFHRVNQIRIFTFKPKDKDSSDIVFKQLEMKANPLNIVFPFHWIINAFYLKYINLKNLSKEEEIKEIQKKIYKAQILKEHNDKININQPNTVYHVYYENPNVLFSRGFKFNSFESNLKNFKLNKIENNNNNFDSDSSAEKFTADDENIKNYFKSSKRLSDLLRKLTTDKKLGSSLFTLDFINLQTNSFLSMLGDLYFLKDLEGNLQLVDRENCNEDLKELPNPMKNYELYIEMFNEYINANYEIIKSLLENLLNNQDNDKELFRSSRKAILKFLTLFFYAALVIIKKSNLAQQNIINDKFVELLNYCIKIIKINNENISNNLLQKIIKNLKTYSSKGFQIENEKCCEFIINPTEPLNLNELVSYPEASSIAVEIEYIIFNNERSKIDIIIISQEHGYNNCKNYNSYNNNNNNYGTAFLVDIGSQSIKKTLFLPGKEIKIINPIDGRMRHYGRDHTLVRSQNLNINNTGNVKSKNILKIKCYPIKTQNYLYKNSNEEKQIFDKFFEESKLCENEFLLWLDYLNNLDYILNWVIQANIKSTVVSKEEKAILENNHFVILYKLGLAKYAEVDINKIKLQDEEKNKFLDDKINIITANNPNDLASADRNDSEILKGKSFKECFEIIYDTIIESIKRIPNNKNNLSSFSSDERKLEILKVCEINWKLICDEMNTKKVLHSFMYDFITGELEEGYGLDIHGLSYNKFKEELIKAELAEKEKLIAEAKAKQAPLKQTTIEENKDEKEEKEKIKNSTSDFYLKILNENKINYVENTKEFIEYFLNLLVTINESNEAIDLKAEKNILFDLLKEIKALVPEPHNYKMLKMIPSFNHKMKNIWVVIEALFLYCLTYHLNISNALSLELLLKEIANLNSANKTDLHNLKNISEFLGKKLNNLIFWMTSRVQYMKDTFDTIKFQSEMICEKNNEFLRNVKNLCLDKIAGIKKEKEEKLKVKIEEEEKIKNAAKQNKKQKAKKIKEENKQPEKSALEKLKEEMGANKPINFKKKTNVKRFYQDITSDNKKKTTSTTAKKDQIKKDEEKINPEISEKKAEDDKFDISEEELKNKSLDDLFKLFPEFKTEFMNKENIKLMKDGIKTAIENDLKEALYGNNEKLKNICEINEITFSESNPNESLKNYFNFIINKLKSVYDFDDNTNCIEMNDDSVLEKIYKDSPYKILSDYVLEKILFLLEISNDNLINILDPSTNANNKLTKVNHILRKNLSKRPTLQNIPYVDIKSNDANKKTDEESFITLNQSFIVKSIFSFIYKSPKPEMIRNHLNSQYKRALVRQSGFDKLNSMISDDYHKQISFISLNNMGILSSALNNSILNGIETTVKQIDCKRLKLDNLLSYNLYHINNEINDFFSLGKNNYSIFSFLKSQDKRSLQNMEVSNIESFYVHKLKNLVLILSDINLLVTYLSNNHKNASSNVKNILNAEKIKDNLDEAEINIPIDILKNFIDNSIKIIINNEINSYPKINKNIASFSSILKSVLGKLICNKNNEKIYSAVLDSLFNSLEEFKTKCYDEQINSVVNILDIIYHIVSMLPAGIFDFTKEKANLNKLLKVILNSNIPHIVNLSCKIAKIFLKNIHSSNANINNNYETDSIEEEIYKSIYEKIGKLWLFKNTNLDDVKDSKTKSYFNSSIAENTKKKYFLFVQMNSPEFDYLFLINALFQWEEKYPTNLSDYKKLIIKTLDDEFNAEEQKKLIEAYNEKCEKDEFLNFYKIDLENFKQKYNPKNFNLNKNAKNEFKVVLHKFKEMVYFNPLKVKTGKIYNISEALNKTSAEINKNLKDKTNKLTELQANREKILKEKQEVHKVEANKEKEEVKTSNENNTQENNENNSNNQPQAEGENPLPFAEANIPEVKTDSISEEKEKEKEPVLSIEEQEYILKNEIEILKIKELYCKRISEHVKTAELIGENASGRGFVIIDGDFTKEKAEEFSNLIWKSFHKLLPYVLNPDSIFIPNFKKYEAPMKTEEEIKLDNSTENKTIELNGHAENQKKTNEKENYKNNENLNLDDIKELKYIFDENLISPKFHDYASLLPGCTNILKETTKQYLNISLMESSVYNKFSETMNSFNEKLFLKMDQDINNSNNSKKPISGNFNELGKKILNDKLTNGKSIYIILEDLMSLVISTNINNQQQDLENLDSNITLIAKLLNNNLKEITAEKWEKELNEEKKFYILGLLIVSSGFFNILRNGSIAVFNNNPKDICKIISGGHLTGKLTSNVIFLKDKCTKIEKVSNANLTKLNPLDISARNKINSLSNELSLGKSNPSDSEMKIDGILSKQNSFTMNTNKPANNLNTNQINNFNCSNPNLIDLINIEELVNSLDCALEIYNNNSSSDVNRNLVFFLLKFFSMFEYEDYLRITNNKNKISDIFAKLNSLTESEKWIDKSDVQWELEFIQAWQRVYTKLDKNSNLFYSPSKSFIEELRNIFITSIDNSTQINNNNNIKTEVEHNIFNKKRNFLSVDQDANELISKLTLPDSAYGADLPKLTDYSKCTLALKNIQNFERYTVEEIYRYCANTYKDNEFENSLQQIRYHLSNNDTSSAKTDIYYIFDQSKVPWHMPLPKENRDMHEVFKEECYPGNYYLAKINQRIARDSGISNLQKLSNLGLNEIPVLLLIVDTSINQALVQYDDYTDKSEINSFWIQLDNLFALDYQPKLPANAYSIENLKFEFDYIQSNLFRLYAKNILINLNRYRLSLNAISLNSYVNMVLTDPFKSEPKEINTYENNNINNKNEFFEMKNLIQFLNLEFWQLNKLSPITGIFSSFKNYIKVKQLDDLTFRSKESFANQDNSTTLDINELLSQINNSKKTKLNQALINNIQLQSSYENNMEEIEKYLCELCTSNDQNLKYLKNWCFESWENLFKDTKHLRFDLFKEYMTQLNQMRSEKQFNLGNMGNKLLALHELADLNYANFCGVILSFEQTAVLGPNAKLSFYSDKDGVNLIHEITAIKNTMSNLQSIIFNHAKIWMNYTPGTRAFYIHDWHIQTRDSELPCCLSFIPHYWSSLIWISDFTTSSLFASYTLDNLEMFKEYIKKLLGFCSSTKIPVDLQRNIFNITNRIILKANKYIQELENKQLICFDSLTLYEKMAIIGIDEFMLIELIKHIDRFNTNNNSDKKDKNFSSSYVVDGVEIILSILSVIKESYHNLDLYFKENFDYSLPIWIEAIIKLGQFLNLFQNVSQLESQLLREIKDETLIKDQIYDVFVIKNIPGYIENEKIIAEVKKIATTFNIQICDSDIDLQIMDKDKEKFDLINNSNDDIKNSDIRIKQTEEIKIESKNENSEKENKETIIADKDQINEGEQELGAALKDKQEEAKVEELIINKFASIDKNYTKEVCLLLDGVKIETLREIAETAEEEPSNLWVCAGCEMENDIENVICIFCDREKTVKPKEKKKKTLMKVDSYNQTVNDILSEFKNALKNNINLNTFSYEVPVEKDITTQEVVEHPKNIEVPVEIEPNKIEEKTKTDENTLNELALIGEGDFGTLKDENKQKKEKEEEKKATMKEEKIIKELEVSAPEDIMKNKSNFNEILSEFYRFRTAKWIKNRSNELAEFINNLKIKKLSVQKNLEIINQLINLNKKQPDLFSEHFLNQKTKEKKIMSTNLNLTESETNKVDNDNKVNEELNNLFNLNFLNLMEDLASNSVDARFELTELTENELRENINLEVLEKVREIIDMNVCKETNISFVFPPKAVRFTEEELDSINCFNSALINKAFKSGKYKLAQIRYYWSIIKYFNNCLLAALPFIKPPDMNSDSSIPKDGEFTYIPFQKSISAFLSSAKGLTFAFTKQNLIREVIAYTEFPEEQIQIPTFKFERLNIFNNLTEDKTDKKITGSNDPAFIRNDNYINPSDNNINNNLNSNIINGNSSEEIEDEENSNIVKEMKIEESMFLQAYEQFKDIDIAFFRSKKAPGDPHIGFKVEFKGELVQGIGGPYRQFFSDISAELQPKDLKANSKILKLLYPSSNNQAEKGDFKDKYVIRPLLVDNNSMNQFEFLGVLMGICIRTGVHLTLDLCSIFWKKISEEALNVDDIREFDEGLLEQINFLKHEIDQETFENSLNKNYCIELTDNTLLELISGGTEKKVNFEDRFTYMKMVLKARLTESDKQIAAIKKGLCKVVPYSLIKLMTYKELEQLVCGKKTVDIDLLKSYTVYSMELTAESDRNKWLWEILSEISEEEKVKFIKFCWGQERLPATKEEYEKLQINFKIKPHIDKKRKDIFPKADTCFFSLELPEYSSKEVMKKLIITAINYDNVSINADKITTENIDHRRDEYHYRDNYDYDSE